MDELHLRKLDKLCSPFRTHLALEEKLICGVTWVLPECPCQISPFLPVLLLLLLLILLFFLISIFIFFDYDIQLLEDIS